MYELDELHKFTDRELLLLLAQDMGHVKTLFNERTKKCEEHQRDIDSLKNLRTQVMGGMAVLSIAGWIAYDYLKTILTRGLKP